MAALYRPWDESGRLGDVIIIGYLIAQGLDGVFTYLGVHIWGVGIEANPLISSAVAYAGPGVGLIGAKLVAMGLGVLLHLRRVHTLVAVLTLVYIVVAIIPWTAVFLTQ